MKIYFLAKIFHTENVFSQIYKQELQQQQITGRTEWFFLDDLG
jgi:hypothetical protein